MAVCVTSVVNKIKQQQKQITDISQEKRNKQQNNTQENSLSYLLGAKSYNNNNQNTISVVFLYK